MNTKHAGIVEDKAETLLVVDDDKVLRRLEVLMLTHFGYGVLEADGPAEAMRLAADTPTIDLLLTDFAMPEANGLELTQQFRRLHPKTPVLMVSGSMENIYGRNEYPDRFAVLAKPFTCEELLEQICALLTGSATHRAVAA